MMLVSISQHMKLNQKGQNWMEPIELRPWQKPNRRNSMSHEMKWPVPVIAFLRARFMATLRLLDEKRAAAPRLSVIWGSIQ